MKFQHRTVWTQDKQSRRVDMQNLSITHFIITKMVVISNSLILMFGNKKKYILGMPSSLPQEKQSKRDIFFNKFEHLKSRLCLYTNDINCLRFQTRRLLMYTMYVSQMSVPAILKKLAKHSHGIFYKEWSIIGCKQHSTAYLSTAHQILLALM